jgi:ribonuclease Z
MELIQAGKAAGAKVLIHEATFGDEEGMQEMAVRKKHSTLAEALDVQRQMGATHLILTHFSQRYPKVPRLVAQQQEDDNVGSGEEQATERKTVSVAFDGMVVALTAASLESLAGSSARLVRVLGADGFSLRDM